MSHRADTACGIDRQTKWNQYTLQKLCCAEGIIMAQFTEESILVSQILKKKICENLSVVWSKNTAFTLQQIKEHQHVENSPLHKEKKHASLWNEIKWNAGFEATFVQRLERVVKPGKEPCLSLWYKYSRNTSWHDRWVVTITRLFLS